MKRYFMSYCYLLRAADGRIYDNKGVGSCVVEEHPIITVMRWNEDLKDRHTVLLYFCEVPEGAVHPLTLANFGNEISP